MVDWACSVLVYSVKNFYLCFEGLSKLHLHRVHQHRALTYRSAELRFEHVIHGRASARAIARLCMRKLAIAMCAHASSTSACMHTVT